MIADQVNYFIKKLTEKTEKNELSWRKMDEEACARLKKEAVPSGGISGDGYRIKEQDSRYVSCGDGAVYLILAETGEGASEYALLVRINEELPIENLCAYGEEAVSQEDLGCLHEKILASEQAKTQMPDALYEFLYKVLEMKR